MKTSIEFNRLRLFDWKSHSTAFRALATLYRKPVLFAEGFQTLSRKHAFLAAMLLYAHYLPYIFLILLVDDSLISLKEHGTRALRLLLTISLSDIGLGLSVGIAICLAVGIIFGFVITIGRELGKEYPGADGIGLGNGQHIGFGLHVVFMGLSGIMYLLLGAVAGACVGLVVAFSIRPIYGLYVGIAIAILFGFGRAPVVGLVLGAMNGFVVGIGIGLCIGLVILFGFGFISGFLAGIGIGLVINLAIGFLTGHTRGLRRWQVLGGVLIIAISFVLRGEGRLAFLLGAGIGLTRLYYLAVNSFFVWPKVRGHLYPAHPVAWDDLCTFAFPGLDRLLVAFTEAMPTEGANEIERLITAYPSQRMEAFKARIVVLARESANLSDLTRLRDIAAKLPEGESVLLKQSVRIAVDLQQISVQQTRLNAINRPMLREPLTQALVRDIENFRYRIAGFRQPIAREFSAAALEWSRVAGHELDRAKSALNRQPVRQLFRAGDPVNRDIEAFVYRDSVIGQLDQQITLASGCPGVVLYARRRMGKTTALTNLKGFLPSEVDVHFMSMQDATVFTSFENFVSKITHGKAIDLVGLADYLNQTNEQLHKEGKRLLLAIDEYENIDHKIGEEVFPVDLLATIRESIQEHRQIIWLFAGSHQITELERAAWTSYLISARTIEIGPFALPETELLLTDPLKHSLLFRRGEDRPHYIPQMWGPSGIERIHRESGGWPHLVQLIAETLIDELNEGNLPEVTPALMERALDRATISGHNVFYELLHKECSVPGEWGYLSAFRRVEEQDEPDDDHIRQSLLRRQLIQAKGNHWRLRIPIMSRWLRQRG